MCREWKVKTGFIVVLYRSFFLKQISVVILAEKNHVRFVNPAPLVREKILLIWRTIHFRINRSLTSESLDAAQNKELVVFSLI